VKTRHFAKLPWPVPEELTLVEAAVLALIHSFCQMPMKGCYASHQTLADILHVGKRTVCRSIQTLRLGGYIEKREGKQRYPDTYTLGARGRAVFYNEEETSPRHAKLASLKDIGEAIDF